MKKLVMIGICLALSMAMVGCQTFDPVVAKNVATITGSATALVALSTPAIATNTQVKAAIYEVTKAVETIVPATNQTFAVAAPPVVDAVVNKMVAEKKLNAVYAPLVKDGCILVFDGIDLVLAKYPKIKNSTEDVNLVVKSFFTAFNATFNPTGVVSAKKPSKEVLDTVKELKVKSKVILKKLNK